MKKILLLSMVFAALVGCGDNNEPDNGEDKITSPEQLERVIRVRGVKNISLRSGENMVMGYDSLAFITRYGVEFSATDHITGQTGKRRGFGAFDDWFNQRDTVSNALLLHDIDVLMDVDDDGDLDLGWFITNANDFVLLGFKFKDGGLYSHPKYLTDQGIVRDTIGYIPNKIRIAASDSITVAFNAKDYNKCQQLFKEAFVFLPITGKKWRELKTSGIE